MAEKNDISQNFSHPIKAESVVILHTTRMADAEVHKVGCAHRLKATWGSGAMDGATLVNDTITEYPDDWYYVAPCARRA